MADKLSGFLADFSTKNQGLAGKFNPEDLVAKDLFKKAKKSDLKPGFIFSYKGKVFQVRESAEEWQLVDLQKRFAGKIIRCNSFKGFNVQIEIMGNPVNKFIYFQNITPLNK